MRFLITVLFIAMLISGWFFFRDKRAVSRTQAWAAQIAPKLQNHVNGRPAPTNPMQPDEANFFWLLYYVNKLEREKLDPGTIITEALNQLGLTEDRAAFVKDSLLANYDTAKKLRILEEPTNLIRLEQGDPAQIRMKGWDGEPVGVGQIVPASVAPGLANCLPNLVLLPTVVRDARIGQLDADALEHAKALARFGFLDRITLEHLTVNKGRP